MAWEICFRALSTRKRLLCTGSSYEQFGPAWPRRSLEREEPPRPRAVHSHKVLRKSKSESSARKRRATMPGSCSRDSAFSFIARSASMY